jgi:DNA polymerase elongation subunit (family B)
MNLNELLLIDIETVPEQANYNELNTDWQNLWEEKAKKNPAIQHLTAEESYSERAGIMAEFGKIICISTAYFFTDADKSIKLKQKTLSSHNEVHLLNDFLLLCDAYLKTKKAIVFTGHNIKEFDIPYICRRLIINNIPLPKYLQLNNLKPWETNMVDTLHWWRFGDFKNYTSLKLIATALQIPSSKDDIDGSQVRNVYYNENGLERIAKYCAKDVQVVAQIILKYNNRPLLDEDAIVS